MSRPEGRHRVGARPALHVTPRSWDQAERATAARLDQVEPGWCVFYGIGLRKFVAIPLWRAPAHLRVEAATVEDLREQMREAELGAMASIGRDRAWVA
ncbi:hypothetical protein DQ384_06300 [Sphaerisporangium album]|uniref:Uncharacterized protein n=1 Tax=Sphaerisporangium album TaxID=509200 RepID=A0A367FPB3_9ACTN|nr:hypothetical protein [Sphaerisporangium album]RCG32121.1 hypothetical protein DQ384_06300 [Sphaerisporangium album]